MPNATETAIAVADTPVAKIRSMFGLISIQKQLSALLPSHITAERFTVSMLNFLLETAKSKPDNMVKVTNCSLESVLSEARKAASDGLLLDGEDAILAIYQDKERTKKENRPVFYAKYQRMVGGLVKMARRTGKLKSMTLEVVYERDVIDKRFQWIPQEMDEPYFEPVDWFSDNRGKPVGVFAVVRWLNGSRDIAILRKSKVYDLARQGRNFYQYQCEQIGDSNPGKNWDAWWKKAALSQALKFSEKENRLTSAVSRTVDTEEYPKVTIDGEEVTATIIDRETGEVKPVEVTGDEEYDPQSDGSLCFSAHYDALTKLILSSQSIDQVEALRKSFQYRKLNERERIDIDKKIDIRVEAFKIL